MSSTDSSAARNTWGVFFHPQGVKAEHKEGLDEVRDAFANLANFLEAGLPDGRYKALVKTKLEEAAMHATKAFTHAGL